MGSFDNFLKADPETDFQMALHEELHKKNYKKAAWLYQKAVDNGHVKAKFFLSEMYFEGRGVDTNHDYAMKLLNESAKSDYDKAIRLLAEKNKNMLAAKSAGCGQSFDVGGYKIDVPLPNNASLVELTSDEYRKIGRPFEGQNNYHVPPVSFLNLQWKVIIGAVNSNIYSIQAITETNDTQETSQVIDTVQKFYLENIGESEDKTYNNAIFSRWRTSDANILFSASWNIWPSENKILITSLETSKFKKS